jgi:uncharacterized metal-binding protein
MSCCCGSDNKVKLIYSCSGSANNGYLADRVFRTLKAEGVASGTCLTAVGADLSGFVVSAQGAEENIIMDGCKVSCRKKMFEKKGLPYTYFVTTDFGVEKKKTEITEEVIERVAQEVKVKLEN